MLTLTTPQRTMSLIPLTRPAHESVLRVRRAYHLVIVATGLSLLGGCGSSDAGPTEGTPVSAPLVPAVRAASVEIRSSTLRVEMTDTLRFDAIVRAPNGDIITGRAMTWRTADSTVARVSSTGLVTGVFVGSTELSVHVDSVSATVRVTVAPEAVAAISLLPATVTLQPERTIGLTVELRSARGRLLEPRPIEWRSSDNAIANVSTAGVITAFAVGGPIAVSASAEGKVATTSVRVVPPPVARIQLVAPSAEMQEGDTARVQAILTDSLGGRLDRRLIAWSSDSAHIVSVDSTGQLVALRTGVSRIRARAEGVEATLAVTSRGLVHRWTFSEEGGPGTTFRDDVRGRSAVLTRVGTSAGVAMGGHVTLGGGSRVQADFVALPSRLLRELPDATIEVWATLHSIRSWSRVFDVGSSIGNTLFMSWSQGVNGRTDRIGFAVGGSEHRLDNSLAPLALDLQHHICLVIDEGAGANGRTRLTAYLDGVARGTLETTYRLRDLIDDNFWLGRSQFPSDESAHASYDELRIHDRALTAAQIRTSFERGPVRTSGTVSLEILRPNGMRDTIRGVDVRFPLRVVARDAQGRRFPVPGVRWSSENPAVASVDSAGRVHARTTGRARVTARWGDASVTWIPEVVSVVRVPVHPYLATPIANAVWEVPVILVAYFPTADGHSIDTLKAPGFWGMEPISLDAVEMNTLAYAMRKKMGVEQGSRFRGYRDSTARPSLGYRVVESIIVYDVPPGSDRFRWETAPGRPRMVDYFKVFSELRLEPAMRSRQVKELWVATSSFDAGTPSYRAGVHRVDDMRADFESNMARPVTGDISNSFRWPDDLPMLTHTYVVHGINWRRTEAEAMHNVGHQLEAMLSYVNLRQDGNTTLFSRDFVGQDVAGAFVTGRAGWTHMPPNTTGNYDYLNATPVASDIEDWRPDGMGAKRPVSVATWGGLTYPWPSSPVPALQRREGQGYVYWWQNFPGLGNRIPHPRGTMTNWWAFVGDWDGSVRARMGLWAGAGGSVAASYGGDAQAAAPTSPGPHHLAHSRTRDSLHR